MDISNFDLSVIYTRTDGSFVINKGLYHVPNEGEYAQLWAQVDEYAKAHPEVVKTEPTQEEKLAQELELLSPEERAERELAVAKAERTVAVNSLTVQIDGMIFDGNEPAQERMARAVLMAESPEETTEWVLADNSVAIVTANQLRRACRAAGKAMGALWVKPYEA